MAISDAQKVDLLFKKVGYGVSKTDTSTNKSPANESVSSPLLIRGDNLYSQSDQITNTATLPTSNVAVAGSTVVAVYRDTLSSSVQTTNDGTAAVNRTWKTGLTDWIGPEFGAGYAVKVYTGLGGTTSTAQTLTALPADGSGNSDSWYFDYQAGVLNFADTNVPSSIGSQVWIVGARYTGAKGITTLPSLTLTGNLSSTNGNIILTNGNLYVNQIYGTLAGGAATASSANVAYYDVVTSLSNNQTYYLEFANVTSGNSITGATTAINVNPSTGTVYATAFNATTGTFTTLSGALAATNITGTVATANVSIYDSITATTTNATFYPQLVDKTTGNVATYSASGINVNPSTSTINALAFAGGSGAFTTLSASGATTLTNGTESTSTGTGAMVVTGGVGIGGNLWVGGNLYAANIIGTTQSILTIIDPLLYLQATNPNGTYNYDIGLYSDYSAPGYRHTGLARNFNTNVWTFFSNVASEPSATAINWNDVGIAYDSVKAGSLLLANTTAATSISTGALQVVGGVGIQGNLYAAGIQNTPIGNTTPSTGVFTTGTFNTATTGGLQAVAIGNVTPGTAVFTTETVGGLQAVAIGNVTPGTAVFTSANATVANITGTTVSTTTTNGALVVAGGTGIGGALNVGGNLTVANIQTTGSGGNITGVNTLVATTGQFSNITVGGLQAIAIGNVTPGNAVFTTTTVGGLQATAIGNVTAGTGAFTTLTSLTASTGGLQATAIGNVTPGTAAFTTATAGGLQAVAIGNATPGTGAFTTLTAQTETVGGLQAVAIGNVTPGTGVFNTLSAGSFQGIIGNITPSTATFTTGNIGGLQAVAIGNITPGTAVFTTANTGGLQAVAIGNVTPGTATFTTGNIGGLQAVAIGNINPGTGAFTTLNATTINAVTLGNIGAKVTGDGGFLSNIISGNIVGTVATANVSLYDNISNYNTNQTFYLQFSNVISGNTASGATTNVNVNPSTGNVYAGAFVGSGAYLTNLSIGSLSGTYPTANVSVYQQLTNSTTNATFYIPFYDKATGNASAYTNTSLNFTPSTGYLYATAASIATVIATTVATSSTITAGGNIVAGSGVTSTSNVTGALISTGGVGIAGNLNAGSYGNSIHGIAGNLLLGQGTPNSTYADSILTINENNAVPVVGHGYTVHLSGQTGKNAVFGADSFGTGIISAFSGRHARGTASAPSAAQNGDVLGGVYFKGYGATTYAQTTPAGMQVVAKENFTDTAQGTAVTIQTVPIGANTAQTAVYIGTDGNIVAQSISPSTSTTSGALVVAGGTGIAGNLWVGANTNVGGNLTVTNAVIGQSNAQFTGNISTLSTADTTAPGKGSFNTPGGASFGSNVYVGQNLYIGPSSYNTVLITPTVIAVDTGSTYAQMAIQNTAGSGSSDFIAYAANYAGASNDHGWADLGFTGNAFNDPNYTITNSLDAYIFGSGAGGVGGNLVLATDYTGAYNDVVVGVGSFYANSEVARFHGNASTSGTFVLKLPTNAVPAANTGAFQVWGGESISGNSYIGGAMTINGGQTANYDFKVRGVNSTNLIWARPSSTYDQVIVGNTIATGSLTGGAKLTINSTDSILLPTGTTGQRPGSTGFSDVTGMFRYNTTLGAIEWYTGATWTSASSSFTVITDEQYNGDGSTVNFTLGAATTTASTIVSINGVMQVPTLAYSITGAGANVLTFTEAPASGDVIDVRRLTTTQTLAGITGPNGMMGFQADNNGAYVYAGPSGGPSVVVAGWDTAGVGYSSLANVTVSSANSATTILTVSNSVYRSGKLVIQATSGTNYQVQETLVIQNGTTATVTNYGIVQTAGNLGIVTATVSGSNTLIQFTAANAGTIVRTKADMLVI